MAEVIQWKPYRNPEDGRSGWISPQGKVVYGENPQQQADQPPPEAPQQTAKEELASLAKQLDAMQGGDVTASSFSSLVNKLSLMSPEGLSKLKALWKQRLTPKEERVVPPVSSVSQEQNQNPVAPARSQQAEQPKGVAPNTSSKEPSNATEAGKQQEGYQPEHQDGGRGGQAEEAGNRDQPERGRQEQKEVIRKDDHEAVAMAPARLQEDFPGRVEPVPGEPNAMHVKTVYGEALARFLKSMGAIWDKGPKRWRIPKAQAYQVYNFLLNPPGKEPAKFSRLGRGRPWTFTLELEDEPEAQEEQFGFRMAAYGSAVPVHELEAGRREHERQEKLRYAKEQDQSEVKQLIAALQSQNERPIIVNVHTPDIKPAQVTVNVPKADPVVVNVPKPDPVVVNVPEVKPAPQYDVVPVRDSDGQVTRFRRVVKS